MQEGLEESHREAWNNTLLMASEHSMWRHGTGHPKYWEWLNIARYCGVQERLSIDKRDL